MRTQLLIPEIVKETAQLVAQLATSAGLRAPLAKVLDQVFVHLAEEVERRGVTRKVAADMFGMVLRAYQMKVGRLQESATETERTLWHAVLTFVQKVEVCEREAVLQAFSRDEPRDVVSMLTDLVSSGLITCEGRGRASVYRATREGDRLQQAGQVDHETLSHQVCLHISGHPGITASELEAHFGMDEAAMSPVLASIVWDGRAQVQGPADGGQARYTAQRLLIPVGSQAGWEAAVLDHFRAVCGALANKLALGAKPEAVDLIGGTTLRFDLCAGHRYEAEVKQLLVRMRTESTELWRKTAEYNRTHPIAASQREQLVFYLGQDWVGAPASVFRDGSS